MQLTWSLVAGGAEVYALTLARNLNAQRFSSLLCAVDEGGALEPELRESGIPYFIMRRRDGIDVPLARRLHRVFCRTGVDIVHTHHFNQLFYGAIAARLAGARVVHTEHDTEAYRRPRRRLLLRVLAPLCDRITAVGEDVARTLRDEVGIPAGRIEVVRSGVDLALFAPLAAEAGRGAARRDLGLQPEDQVAVCVARLYPEKNHRLLLAAFAEVARHNPSARLLIVGEGVERPAIEKEIRRRRLDVHALVLGVRRDIPRVLAAADIFVLASQREGLPIALLEAMAAARPVVATAVGDVPAVVRHGHNGLLVSPGDVAALTAALATLFADPALAIRMGAAARQAAEAYSVAAMIRRYERLYTAAASPADPRARDMCAAKGRT